MEHSLRFAFSFDEQRLQHTCGAQRLSWSPTLQPKYWKQIHFIIGFKARYLQANVISPHI